MARVERNGLSGLLLRCAVIAIAVAVFSCAPKAPPAKADAPAAVSDASAANPVAPRLSNS